MRIFISQSDVQSRTVAEALAEWLPDVIHLLKPWVSSADVAAGARWNAEVSMALAQAKFGILCVTPESQQAPWLLFEAGALAKTLDANVCPYLIGMRVADLSGPLAQFQAKTADADGTLGLLSAINAALESDAVQPDRLKRMFERNWPALESRLKALPEPAQRISRPQEEILAEVLETVRTLARGLPAAEPRIDVTGAPSPTEMETNLCVVHVEDAFPKLPRGTRLMFRPARDAVDDIAFIAGVDVAEFGTSWTLRESSTSRPILREAGRMLAYWARRGRPPELILRSLKLEPPPL